MMKAALLFFLMALHSSNFYASAQPVANTTKYIVTNGCESKGTLSWPMVFESGRCSFWTSRASYAVITPSSEDGHFNLQYSCPDQTCSSCSGGMYNFAFGRCLGDPSSVSPLWATVLRLEPSGNATLYANSSTCDAGAANNGSTYVTQMVARSGECTYLPVVGMYYMALFVDPRDRGDDFTRWYGYLGSCTQGCSNCLAFGYSTGHVCQAFWVTSLYASMSIGVNHDDESGIPAWVVVGIVCAVVGGLILVAVVFGLLVVAYRRRRRHSQYFVITSSNANPHHLVPPTGAMKN